MPAWPCEHDSLVVVVVAVVVIVTVIVIYPELMPVIIVLFLFPNKQSSSGWQVQLHTKGRDPASKGERKIIKKKNSQER